MKGFVLMATRIKKLRNSFKEWLLKYDYHIQDAKKKNTIAFVTEGS